EIPQAIIHGNLDKAEELVKWWLDLLGEDFYIEIQRHKGLENLDIGKDRTGKRIFSGMSQEDVNQQLLKYAEKYNIKVIATNDTHYVEEEDWQPHDILLCVNTGSLLNDEKRFKFSSSDFYFKTQDQMKALFRDREDSIANTMEIYSKIEPLQLARDVLLPAFPLPPGIKTQDEFLRHLTYEGAKKRYGDITQNIRERLDFELEVIRKSGYPGYFLIVQDFTTVAREMGVSVGPGRGSAAGSAVAYCIGITNVDPIKYDLLFERFLNPERVSMPDIDIDFDDVGRQKVIDYVIDKYGQNQVAQIITYGAMKAKSSIKDVGRVMDIPLSEVVAVTKTFPDNLSASLAGVLAPKDISPKLKGKLNSDEKEQAYRFRELAAQDNQIGEMIRTAQRLEGSIRNTGIHACGVVITPDDITKYVPVKTDKNSDMLVSQFDNSVAEDAGLLKMDFLGLKTLSIIRDAVRLIKDGKGVELDPDEFPLDDELTYELFQRGETVAIFQYESAGMQKYMKELVPTTFEDLIAMNALYRPGPLEYIPDFIERKHGRQQISYDLPAMEEYLHETYGICVTGDTLVYNAKTGQQTRIDELENQVKKFTVQGVDDDLQSASAKISHWICNGEKEVFQVKLRNGSTAKMTANHRVLTEDGWKELGELQVGDYVATPRQLFAEAEQKCDSNELVAAVNQTLKNGSVPEFVFSLKLKLIVEFVAEIWESIGYVNNDLYYFNVNNSRLATDLQTLLLRLDIQVDIETKEEELKYRIPARYPILKLADVTASHNYEVIKPRITAHEMCGNATTVLADSEGIELLLRPSTTVKNSYKLVIENIEKFNHFVIGKQETSELSTHSMCGYSWFNRSAITNDGKQNSGVRWEEIIEITPAGTETVYDITVENIHNFVGNNIILHNCVYQEQVMLLSQKLANFSKGEADMLRKAMGKKKKKLIDQMHPQFIEGGESNGHPAEVLNKVWKDWEAFASYAFNKSHSTCYAFIAFQTAYLKAHYPAEFMASVLTHNKTDITKLTFFLRECKRMGLTVLGPHVNESQSDFSVNKKGHIRCGMSGLKGLGEGPVEAILEERKNGD
ncbi:MAG: DNA polymerase III subunit alpha, partial [Saprospiraceae bacterium]